MSPEHAPPSPPAAPWAPPLGTENLQNSDVSLDVLLDASWLPKCSKKAPKMFPKWHQIASKTILCNSMVHTPLFHNFSTSFWGVPRPIICPEHW